MKKAVLSVFALLLVAAVLLSCGSEGKETTINDVLTSEEVSKIEERACQYVAAKTYVGIDYIDIVSREFNSESGIYVMEMKPINHDSCFVEVDINSKNDNGEYGYVMLDE